MDIWMDVLINITRRIIADCYKREGVRIGVKHNRQILKRKSKS